MWSHGIILSFVKYINIYKLNRRIRQMEKLIELVLKNVDIATAKLLPFVYEAAQKAVITQSNFWLTFMSIVLMVFAVGTLFFLFLGIVVFYDLSFCIGTVVVGTFLMLAVIATIVFFKIQLAASEWYAIDKVVDLIR